LFSLGRSGRLRLSIQPHSHLSLFIRRLLMSRKALLIVCTCALGCPGFLKEALGYTYAEIVVPGLTGAIAAAINDQGEIVGYGTGTSGTVGFIDREGTFTLISFPGSISTQANGLNNGGDIVGTYIDAAGFHGFKYSAGAWTAIDAPAPAPPNMTRLTAINNLGQIAGNTSTGPGGAFVDTGGTFAFVGSTNLIFTVQGLNDSGEVVGVGLPRSGRSALIPLYGMGNELAGQVVFGSETFTTINNSGQAILSGRFFQGLFVSTLQSSVTQTTPGQMILFPGAATTAALGLNNNGTIVGSYIDAASVTHAFLAAPDAEPACTTTTSSGPPSQMIFSLRDSSGVAQIIVTSSINATVNIPSFNFGTTSSIAVTSNAINPAQTATVILTVRNTAGFSSSCGANTGGTGARWLSLGGVLTSDTAVSLSRDGSLDAYALGSDAKLWHISQTDAGGPWGSWSTVGGPALVSEPALVTDGAGKLEVFATSTDGGLWNISQPTFGNWSGATWRNIAAGVKGRPAVFLNTFNGKLQVFVRAAYDSLIYLTQTGAGSSSWTDFSLGGVIASNPTASFSLSRGLTSIWALGADQSLWETEVSEDDEVLAQWSSLGGTFKGDLAVLPNNPSLYFGRGSDDAVWIAGATGWESLGGWILSDPRAVRNADGLPELFVEGADRAVWHNTEAPAGDGFQWSGWSTLGGIITGEVVPAVDASGAVSLFVRGSDSGLWYLTQPSPGLWQ
jgi:hypothetical protein